MRNTLRPLTLGLEQVKLKYSYHVDSEVTDAGNEALISAL